MLVWTELCQEFFAILRGVAFPILFAGMERFNSPLCKVTVLFQKNSRFTVVSVKPLRLNIGQSVSFPVVVPFTGRRHFIWKDEYVIL